MGHTAVPTISLISDTLDLATWSQRELLKICNFQLLHTKCRSFGSGGFREDFFHVFPIISLWQIMTPLGHGCMDHRGTVGSIYKEDHYTLLHTKYESSGPCDFGEEDFFMFSHCKAMEANDPRGGTIFDTRGMIGRIYVKLRITMLFTKYRSYGACGFRKDSFMYFPL